jgi:hypothetical protein
MKDIVNEMVGRTYGSLRKYDLQGLNELLSKDYEWSLLFGSIEIGMNKALDNNKSKIKKLISYRRKRSYGIIHNVNSLSIIDNVVEEQKMEEIICNEAWFKNIRKTYFNTKKPINKKCLGYLRDQLPIKTVCSQILKNFVYASKSALQKMVFTLAVFCHMMVLLKKNKKEEILDNLLDKLLDPYNRFCLPMLQELDNYIANYLKIKINRFKLEEFHMESQTLEIHSTPSFKIQASGEELTDHQFNDLINELFPVKKETPQKEKTDLGVKEEVKDSLGKGVEESLNEKLDIDVKTAIYVEEDASDSSSGFKSQKPGGNHLIGGVAAEIGNQQKELEKEYKEIIKDQTPHEICMEDPIYDFSSNDEDSESVCGEEADDLDWYSVPRVVSKKELMSEIYSDVLTGDTELIDIDFQAIEDHVEGKG